MLSLLDLESGGYRVELDAAGQLRWLRRREQQVFTSEPEAGPMRILGAKLLGSAIPPDWL